METCRVFKQKITSDKQWIAHNNLERWRNVMNVSNNLGTKRPRQKVMSCIWLGYKLIVYYDLQTRNQTVLDKRFFQFEFFNAKIYVQRPVLEQLPNIIIFQINTHLSNPSKCNISWMQCSTTFTVFTRLSCLI